MRLVCIFIMTIFYSCKTNEFIKDFSPNKNNYWDIKYYHKYKYTSPAYGYNVQRNGTCFFYQYQNNNDSIFRKIKKYDDDVIYKNKWSVNNDSIILLMNRKYKIITYSEVKAIFADFTNNDTLILERSTVD